MKRNELASIYMSEYEETDVTIVDVNHISSDLVVFDLSDGTHWLSDNNVTAQVTESLTDSDIVWSDNDAWVVANDDGSISEISYV